MEKNKQKLKCTREDCQYEWEYKGDSKFYVTCPRCYRKVNVNTAKDNFERNGTKDE